MCSRPRRFGGTGILVRTGHGAAEEERMAEEGGRDGGWLVADDLAGVAALIERLES